MAMKATIIGSFRKFYDQICLTYQIFEKNGIDVLSPRKSSIIDPSVDFVILKSDPKDWKEKQIQDRVLEKIVESDFVYIVNPSGYIGPTVYFEMGFAISQNIQLYSLKPAAQDLFRQYIHGVFSPEELVKHLS